MDTTTIYLLVNSLPRQEIGPEALARLVYDLLSSGRSSEDLQGPLVELLSYDALDVICQLLEDRRAVVADFKHKAAPRRGGAVEWAGDDSVERSTVSFRSDGPGVAAPDVELGLQAFSAAVEGLDLPPEVRQDMLGSGGGEPGAEDGAEETEEAEEAAEAGDSGDGAGDTTDNTRSVGAPSVLPALSAPSAPATSGFDEAVAFVSSALGLPEADALYLLSKSRWDAGAAISAYLSYAESRGESRSVQTYCSVAEGEDPAEVERANRDDIDRDSELRSYAYNTRLDYDPFREPAERETIYSMSDRPFLKDAGSTVLDVHRMTPMRAEAELREVLTAQLARVSARSDYCQCVLQVTVIVRSGKKGRANSGLKKAVGGLLKRYNARCRYQNDPKVGAFRALFTSYSFYAYRWAVSHHLSLQPVREGRGGQEAPQ